MQSHRITGMSDEEILNVTVRRVDASERVSVLDAIIELEHIVYEPARRDTRAHLGTAFDEGVVIVAEEVGRFVGCALGGPLESFAHIRGPDIDPMLGRKNTLYAMATTVEPSMRGRGLGRRLKEALIKEARADYSYVAGRTRLGHTDAMMHINRSLGAHEVARIDNAYKDGGTCSYYRISLETDAGVGGG